MAILQLVQITAQYSNAVLVAVLPCVSDFCHKAALQVPQPLTAEYVARFDCDPREGEVGGGLLLRNGFHFIFERGHVTKFESPRSYSALQDPDQIERFLGPVNMSEGEAIALARKTLQAVAGTAAQALIDVPPFVFPLPTLEGKIVPSYRIQWAGSNQRWPAIDVEIDASRKSVEMITLLATNFSRQRPKVDVVPPRDPTNPFGKPPRTSDATAPISLSDSNALLAVILPQIEEYSRKLRLSVPFPAHPSAVKNCDILLKSGVPSVDVRLTNGFKFLFEHGYIMRFCSPDCFFAPSSELQGKTYEDFVAHVSVSRDELISIGCNAIRSLGYSDDDLPLPGKPWMSGGPTRGTDPDLARFFFQWDLGTPEQPYQPLIAAFEVDGSTGTLKSLSINHTNLYRKAPRTIGTLPSAGDRRK